MNLAVIFGGMSTEHDVSIVSGVSVLKNLNKEKYTIFPIYINQQGEWFFYQHDLKSLPNVKVGDSLTELEKIENPITLLKKMDCVFPVLHGLYGEDGTIQGMLELCKVPYVGCKVLASSVAMDKAYAKVIFEKAGLKQVPYCYVRKYQDDFMWVHSNLQEERMTEQEILNKIESKIPYPMFVKPSNSGSSVGVRKVQNKEELKEAILYASQFDNKILIEEGKKVREIECAVLGKKPIFASCTGEILSAEEFYSFDSKYQNEESRTVIPAPISEEIEKEIQRQAKMAFKAIDGTGLARVDFFLEKETNEIYINEINTMPGFTSISMYAKLMEASSISYTQLLDDLINLAKEQK